jgi:aryl-alcohol dehydrogenase-like predicted oxidoreductase
MQYAQFGATGVFVSRIALGTMTFGGSGTAQWDRIGALGESAAGRLLNLAIDHGVNLVDTADMYAAGECEEMLGRILKPHRADVILATKLAGRMGDGPNDVGLSRLHVMRALEDSLRRLRTDHVDLYQVHMIDPVTPIEETLRALDDAVRQGKVRYIGVSNLAAWQIARALGISRQHGLARFVSTQSYYSLAGRDIEAEIVPLASEENLGLLVYSPLAGGFLSGKFGREGASDETARRVSGSLPPVREDLVYDIVDVLRDVAGRHGATAAQVALAWVLAQPAVTSVIVGVKREQQLSDNLAAIDLRLSPDDLAALTAVSQPAPTYPGWAQADLSWRYPVDA